MPDGTESDFELAKYERDREHELALNHFTHNLEVEQLKLLILLNGGAATAFLTFSEHQASPGWLLLLPVALWLIGLFLGAKATLKMRKAQAQYGKLYRHRRQVTEFLRIADRRALPAGISSRDCAKLQARAEDEAIGAALASGDVVALHACLAEIAREEADAGNSRVDPLSRFSLYAFLAGALVAGAALALAPADPESGVKVELKASAAR